MIGSEGLLVEAGNTEQAGTCDQGEPCSVQLGCPPVHGPGHTPHSSKVSGDNLSLLVTWGSQGLWEERAWEGRLTH